MERAGSKDNVFLFPIGQIDLSCQQVPLGFQEWIKSKIMNGLENYSRDIPIFKLWHLNGSLESFSTKQTLLSFYELDQPTNVELNICKNNNTLFSSQYSVDAFASRGVKCQYVPLAFDSFNFRQVTPKRHSNDRIVFNVCGKFEKRKCHEKVIKAWIKKFGNNPNYSLQCAIHNPFLNDDQNRQIINKIVEGNKPFNVNFYPLMAENSVYNDFLNSADIILGMSGGEGWGLGEFHSVALGKHAVILNAHAHKGWANNENSVLVEANGKEPAYDGMFFAKGQAFNQGNIFTWSDDAFIAGCEKAVERVMANKLNNEGLKLQYKFSREKFVESILDITEKS